MHLIPNTPPRSTGYMMLRLIEFILRPCSSKLKFWRFSPISSHLDERMCDVPNHTNILSLVLAVKLEMLTDGAKSSWCDQPLSWKHFFSFFFSLARQGWVCIMVCGLIVATSNEDLNVHVGWVPESSHLVSNCKSRRFSIKIERQKNIRVQRQQGFFVRFKCDKWWTWYYDFYAHAKHVTRSHHDRCQILVFIYNYKPLPYTTHIQGAY
jgi:hypothetical protein